MGEENSESVRIVDGKRSKVVKRVEIYSDGSRIVRETNEDESGVSEKRYRLDREGNQLRLENNEKAECPVNERQISSDE